MIDIIAMTAFVFLGIMLIVHLHDEQHREVAAHIAEATRPRWSSEKPTVPGWYRMRWQTFCAEPFGEARAWAKYDENGNRVCGGPKAITDSLAAPRNGDDSCEWAGPYAEPIEPEEGA